MNSRIRPTLYIYLKTWLCCCSLAALALQQLKKRKITYSRKFAYKKAFNLKKLIVFHCWHFHLGNCCKSLISRVSFILLWVCNRPLAKLSKWSHFMLWPVDVTGSAIADEWLLLVMTLRYFVFLSCNLRLVWPNYVELLAVPTASLINNPGYLRTGESVFVGKKDNTMCPLENRTRRSKQP